MTPRFISSIDQIAEEQWNGLDGAQTAFTCHQFLLALENSGCVGPSSGWHPSHLIWEDSGTLLGALPLYRKYHSYGEYVFDWSWAEAFQQTGQPYYPKLLCAIPFTPVPGPRLFTAPAADISLLWARTLEYLGDHIKQKGMSSLHLLFSDADLSQLKTPTPLLQRQDVQFVWRNRDYQKFDDFLTNLKSSKRKQIRRERRRVEEQGIEITTLYGADIDSESLDFFCQCYQATYLKRSGHEGYLSPDFFRQLRSTMCNRLLLFVARRNGKPVASALFFVDSYQLCGRYWGCIEEIDFLHFELCYYRGIDFAIAHHLASFNPGTQGEHKLVRGFEPMRTQSFHLIAHRQFNDAVRRSLQRENTYIDAYEESAQNHLPFRQN